MPRVTRTSGLPRHSRNGLGNKAATFPILVCNGVVALRCDGFRCDSIPQDFTFKTTHLLMFLGFYENGVRFESSESFQIGRFSDFAQTICWMPMASMVERAHHDVY